MPHPGGGQKGEQAGQRRNASLAEQVVDVSVDVQEGEKQAGCQRAEEERIPPEVVPAEQGIYKEGSADEQEVSPACVERPQAHPGGRGVHMDVVEQEADSRNDGGKDGRNSQDCRTAAFGPSIA